MARPWDSSATAMASDSSGVMNAGRLEQLAAPDELYTAPVSEFVADFVGVTNRVEAVVEGGVGQVWGGQVPLLPGSAGDGRATILIRPEGVLLDKASDGTNATVVSSSFLGGHGKVVTQGDGGNTVVVQVSNAEVTSFAPGDRVRLRPRGDRALAVAS